MVTDVDAVRLAGTILAFGTVLPGVFWIDHWLGARGVAAAVRLRPLRFGPPSLLAPAGGRRRQPGAVPARIPRDSTR